MYNNFTSSQGVQSDQLINGFLTVYPNQVPPIQGVRLPPQFQVIVPSVVFQLISIIQERARTNPVRTILFNWMSVNSFQNQQFSELVQHTCVLAIIDFQRSGGQIEPHIAKAVTGATEQYTARIVEENRHLQNNFDQNQLYQINKLLSEYQHCVGLVNSFLNAGNAPSGYQRPGMGMQPQYQQQNNWQQNNNWQQQNAAPQNAVFDLNSNQNQSTMFTRVNPNSAFGDHVSLNGRQDNSKSTSRFSQSNYTPRHTPVETVREEPQQITHREVFKEALTKQWEPNIDTPFMYVTEGDKVIVLVEKEKNVLSPIMKDKSKMDKSEHFVRAEPLNKTTDVLNLGNSMERVTSLKEELKAPEELENISVAGEDNKVIMDTSFNNAILTADVFLRTMKKKDASINMFRVRGMVIDAVVSDKPSDKFADMLSVQTTFSQLIASMQHIKTLIVSGKCDYADEISFNFFNRRLTNALNNFIKKRLCLDKGWVDSFVDDAGGILRWMRERKGVKYEEILEAHQHDIIMSAIDIVRDDNKRLLDEDYLGDIDSESKPFTSYITDEYTLTAVELFSDDIKLNIPKPKDANIGVAVFEQSTELFYNILNSSIEYSKVHGDSKTNTYVKTLDGVIIEVYDSLFTQGGLTIYVNQ